MFTWLNFQQDYHTYDIGAENGVFALDFSRVFLPETLDRKRDPDAFTFGHRSLSFTEYYCNDDVWDLVRRGNTETWYAEIGDVLNTDENRAVGHYWLRTPELAPEEVVTKAADGKVIATDHPRTDIPKVIADIKAFAAKIHSGEIKGGTEKQKKPFKNILCIGIGGSSLGPQFVTQALSKSGPNGDKLAAYFLDNTDPDGMDFVFGQLEGRLDETLVIVTSKSGGTKETTNGMLETKVRYEKAGLKFGAHAVAITGKDSKLDMTAIAEGFLARFPMWEWVGGRTSELAAVGLLPAALQGFDIDGMLKGAATMDELTRKAEGGAPLYNPAAMLALAWHYLTEGVGKRDMVILPYKDRLSLFSRYLQQLVMESLGKERDREGKIVNQGIAVYGNKGSTDQHAYVQQLREGVSNFFVVFIEVLRDREGESIDVDGAFPGVTSGDYLHGFFLGTRAALTENKRPSITITVDNISAFTVGMLIALFERAVGFYAALVGINAYHQPGVEAGKKAATKVLEMQVKVEEFLAANKGTPFTVHEIADKLNLADSGEIIFKVCEHLAANKRVAKGGKRYLSGITYTHSH